MKYIAKIAIGSLVCLKVQNKIKINIENWHFNGQKRNTAIAVDKDCIGIITQWRQSKGWLNTNLVEEGIYEIKFATGFASVRGTFLKELDA